MHRQRLLIINADDFGLSPGVNRGIVHAHEHGVVTSASLMVRRPGAADAAAHARRHPALGVGLHVDLGDWELRDGHWRHLDAPVDDLADADAVGREVRRQFAAFIDLLGRPPTHVDSHQHVHRAGPARAAVAELARDLSIVARDLTPSVRYVGSFYGQYGAAGAAYPEGITADNLVRIVGEVDDGITEIGCHPGQGADSGSRYAAEREQEVRALCDPAVRAAIRSAGITLGVFPPATAT